MMLDCQRLQQGLLRESAQLKSSDVMMEHVLNRDIVVTVNITVLMAPTSSTAVRSLQIWLLLNFNVILMAVIFQRRNS